MAIEQDFTILYEHFFHDVYLFVLAMSRDPGIAEEITQETFFKALKEMDYFRGECSAKTWLCQIAKNQYISYTRKTKPVQADTSEQLEHRPAAENIEVSCIQKDEALSIYKVLHLLDEPYKEVFTLRTLGELSYREISDIFGKQESWARVTYYRARAKIREQLNRKEDT